MIDIKTNRIIDILNSRESSKVATWLKSFPNIKIVSRDGSNEYAKAIKSAHPNAIQINDRFHIIKNLTEYLKSYMTKIMKFKIKIEKPRKNMETSLSNSKTQRVKLAQVLSNDGLSPYEISKKIKMDIRTVNKYLSLNINTLFSNNKLDKKHKESVNKKEISVNIVKDLFSKGFSMAEISRKTGFTKKTVKKYLNPNVSLVHGSYGSSRASILDGYFSTIEEMINSGANFSSIEENLNSKGYKGSASSIRMYISKKQRLENEIESSSFKNNYYFVERSKIIKMLYMKPEKIDGISADDIDSVFQLYPVLPKLYELVDSFKKLLFEKKVKNLSKWIKKAEKLDIDEIKSFLNGISMDIDGVKKAIKYKYSNGLAEGKINKIKVIKRIMYGRSSFAYLRRKILELEKFRYAN